MATWTAAYIDDLPDSSFLVIEGGGTKDDQNRTTPRSLRHFPVKDAQGAVDADHVRNALARIPQSNLSADQKQRATAEAERLLRGVDAKKGLHMSTTDFAKRAAAAKAQSEALRKQAVTQKTQKDAPPGNPPIGTPGVPSDGYPATGDPKQMIYDAKAQLDAIVAQLQGGATIPDVAPAIEQIANQLMDAEDGAIAMSKSVSFAGYKQLLGKIEKLVKRQQAATVLKASYESSLAQVSAPWDPQKNDVPVPTVDMANPPKLTVGTPSFTQAPAAAPGPISQAPSPNPAGMPSTPTTAKSADPPAAPAPGQAVFWPTNITARKGRDDQPPAGNSAGR